MKRAIKINLHGLIFHIDEDAYERLKKYLDAIGRYFSNKEEGEEILKDIESRIAELFLEKIGKDEVITLKLVEDVIKIMGDPEEIISSSEPADATESGGEKYTFTGRKSRKLYRDPENSVIGGVCGGLGAYFNIDPLIFRILFIVFFFFGGASILLYLILWIVLPRAVTAAQKLEMSGEPVNVSNIERKVREEYESAKENVKAAANSDQVKKAKKATGNFFSEVGKILLVFVKVILIIIGTGFVLGGIGIIIAILTGTFIGLNIFPFGSFDFTLGELLSPFTDPVNLTLLILSLSLLFLIPVLAMIYGLIKLIFSIRTNNRGLTIGTVSLWVIALIMTIGILALETGNYAEQGYDDSTNNISINSDTLFVTINTDFRKGLKDGMQLNLDRNRSWYITKDMKRIYGMVELDIEESTTENFQLEVSKKSKGKNEESSGENASNIKYSYRISNNVLVLDYAFFIEGKENWRFPEVEVRLLVPEGKFIYLEEETGDLLDDVYNTSQISKRKMSGKTWKMTEEGLELVN